MSEIPRSKILLPLYIYPHPGAWDPLYAAVESNPKLHFIIMINPNSGPGAPPWWPNEDYVREIPRLNAYENVQVVGYVRTDYCRRPKEEVMADVATYAKWSCDSGIEGLSVEGVFFDETPNSCSDGMNVRYLQEVSQYVKATEGILGKKTVIHNPGTVVSSELAEAGADIVTVAELNFTTYQNPDVRRSLKTSSSPRSRSCMIVHGTPTELVREVTQDVRGEAEYVFVTSLEKDYYHGFAPSWEAFVAALTED